MKRRSTIGLVIAAILAAATSCSNGPHRPIPSPTPPEPDHTPSSWLSPAPTREPDKPDTVTDRTRTGALTFVEYYYALVNYGRATGEWDPVKKRSLDGCDGCSDFWSPHPDRFDSDHNINVRPGDGEVNWGGDSAIMTFEVSVFPTNVFPEHQGLAFVDEIDVVHKNGHWLVESIDPTEIAPLPQESLHRKIQERASKWAEKDN